MKKMQIDEQFPYVCQVNVDGKEFKVHCNVEITFRELIKNELTQAVEAVSIDFPPMYGFFNVPPNPISTAIGRIVRKTSTGGTEFIRIFMEDYIYGLTQNMWPEQNNFYVRLEPIQNGDDVYLVMIPSAYEMEV